MLVFRIDAPRYSWCLKWATYGFRVCAMSANKLIRLLQAAPTPTVGYHAKLDLIRPDLFQRMTYAHGMGSDLIHCMWFVVCAIIYSTGAAFRPQPSHLGQALCSEAQAPIAQS